MDNIHSLLKRQMKRYLAGVNPSPEFQAFLEAVNRAYFDFDADRNMLERSFDFSSQELLQANVGFRKANEELQKLAAVVQHSTELISLADASGRLLFLNEAGCRMLGIDPADVSRHALPDLMAEGSRVRFESEMLPALREEQGWEGELQYRNMQTGVRIDVHSILFSVKGAADSSYMANIALDITESNKIAQSLRDSEQFLAGVFTGIQDGIMVLDRDLRILRMNATMEKWFADGLPATGKKCFELCHHSSKPCNLCP
ncbi:MAG: PAS domain S-box protein, partial [Candidatus Omnitrophica bacterium]|nr:PAS domain S-box protein [Candidatus Omnitrophota bacterium]